MPVGWAIAGGSALNYLGSQQSSKTAAKGQKRSLREQRRQFNLINEQLDPFRKAGLSGLAGVQTLLKDPSSILQDPAYKFALGEGQRAITGKAAAGGTLQSGATLKDLTRFGQGLATSTYQQQIQNQMGLANLGGQAAMQGGQIGAQMSGQMGNTMAGISQAQAAGQMGMTNAVSGGLQDYAKYQMMQEYMGSGAGTGYGGMNVPGDAYMPAQYGATF